MASTQDRTQLVELYRREGPGLAGLARVLGVPATECEDLVQEAFVRLHRRWDAIGDRDDLGGYLRTTVVNLVRDRARRGDRRPEVAVLDAPSAEVEAAQRRLAGEVGTALARLSERQRECVVLRYYAGLSDTEVARATGLGLGSVKTHLRRGLRSLRPLLAVAAPAQGHEEGSR